ncbi:MAG TPA: pitrilysin family protein [Ktedonobacterales bacterium]|nr:pitrilysin family protein [Ktedonobacterales bacterium]
MAPTQTQPGGDGTRLLHYTLPNGLEILGQQMPDLESISVCFHVRTGARDEHDPALFGVSHFLEHMVFKGTTRRDAEQITLDFNNMGAEFNAFTSNEQTVYYARVLGEYLPNAIDLLSDMMRPRLDAHDFALERNVILEEIARSEDVPSGQAYRKLLQTYFASHALGHEVLGTRESIRNLTVEQMHAYANRRYASNNLILAIAGDFHWQDLLDLAAEKCGAWQPGEAGRTALPHMPARSMAQVYVKPALQQQILLLAWPSLSYQDPDIYAAHLAAMVLGDGTGSRLFWNIFQKGLAETAVASLSAYDQTGMVVSYVSTTPDHAAGVLELVKAELRSIQEDGVTEDELRRAKDKLVSRVVLDGESAYSRMQDLAYTWVTEHRLRTIEEEMEEIEKVQVADVRRVLDRFPYTEHQVLTAYGPLRAEALGISGSAEEFTAEGDEAAAAE